jgi:hypothetical protein
MDGAACRNEMDNTSCLDFAVILNFSVRSGAIAEMLFEYLRYRNPDRVSQIDPYTGKAFSLPTGGICRAILLVPGQTVPRQTVVRFKLASGSISVHTLSQHHGVEKNSKKLPLLVPHKTQTCFALRIHLSRS